MDLKDEEVGGEQKGSVSTDTHVWEDFSRLRFICEYRPGDETLAELDLGL